MNLKQLKLLNLAQMHDFYTKSYAALKRIKKYVHKWIKKPIEGVIFLCV